MLSITGAVVSGAGVGATYTGVVVVVGVEVITPVPVPVPPAPAVFVPSFPAPLPGSTWLLTGSSPPWPSFPWLINRYG